MTIYIAATPDKLELPCFIADTPTELARIVRMNPATVRGYISRRQVAGGYRFGKVEVDHP